MTKHEIHLRFMEAALEGTALKMFGGPISEQEIAHKAKKIADAALEAYLARWPDVVFQNYES